METFATLPREDAGLTVVHAAHDAFRRDLERLGAAVTAGKARAPHVRAGWENLKQQLHLHHRMEDALLWPRVAQALGGRRADLGVLAEMEAEHARIGPLLVAVDAALEDGGDLAGAAGALRDALETHLRHEEISALPLARSVLGPEDWRGIAGSAHRDCGSRMTLFVPWIVDGIAPVERSRFLSALPEAARARNRLVWEPHYRRRRLWTV
ncbi:hemerythrin domain-containing protein [Actinomadura graeca]|uniref:Hemerythrin domain-containing protein n=1 Tax=Actinomadura graeca TaxID=2750812 RepID=A0ABX8QPR5_9ACTN|nr:hemerythrin domain-containing protein [Actinomadura graeca]QXJ19732.1 hemerythrin domain-containing protein [Actinomadura graeca]